MTIENRGTGKRKHIPLNKAFNHICDGLGSYRKVTFKRVSRDCEKLGFRRIFTLMEIGGRVTDFSGLTGHFGAL